jgi:Tfp pilus assembly protein PilF
VAALFGLHPLHVQSVAWVAERKDVLSTFFFLLTLWVYAQYVSCARCQVSGEKRTPNIEHRTSNAEREESHITYPASRYCLLCLFLFALGLMSKPMVVTLPCVLLLLDYWPLERWKHQSIGMLVAEKAPFFLLAAIVSVVTFMVQKSGGAVGTIEGVPLFVRMGNALVSYGRYLGKMFWPVNLAVLYPHPGRWPAWVVLLSGLLLLGISVLVVALRRQRPWLPVGWFWFVGTLVPVIGLVQVGEQSMADRYTYVPMIGVLILFTWGIHELTGRWCYRRVVLSTVAAAAVLLCILLTRQQIGYWRDSETLFRHAIAVAGDSRTACYKLGVALGKQGHFDEAISQFQTALKLEPNDMNVLCALGMAWNGKGRLDEAIASFQEVLRLKPDNADAHNNLGFVLSRKGRLDEAISQYQEALRLKPDYVFVRNNLGVALARKGRLDEAIEQFQEALRLEPNNVGVLYNLGLALNGKGRLDEAIASFQKVLKLEPDYADAHYNLGLVLGKEGRLNEAISQFQEVLRLDPNNDGTRSNLAAMLKMKDAPGRQPVLSTQP